MNEDTQKLLDELSAPSVVDMQSAKQELLDVLDVLEKIDAQDVKLDALFRRAQLGEEDPAVLGHFEMGRQTFGAQRRLIADFRRAVDELLTTFEQTRAWLNGVVEERRVVDEDKHEELRQKARRAIEKTRTVDIDAARDIEAVVNELLPALTALLTGAPRMVRTPSFRSVAAEAGYDPWPARAVKKKQGKK